MASKLVKIVSKCSTALPVLQLANQSIYIEEFGVEGIVLGGWGEELCHNKKVRICGAGNLQQVLTHVNGCAMGVVQSKTVENTCHLSDVFGHVFPEERAVSWTFSESKFNTIAPDVDCPAQVVEVDFSREVDIGSGIQNPAIVHNLRLLLVAEH